MQSGPVFRHALGCTWDRWGPVLTPSVRVSLREGVCRLVGAAADIHGGGFLPGTNQVIEQGKGQMEAWRAAVLVHKACLIPCPPDLWRVGPDLLHTLG